MSLGRAMTLGVGVCLGALVAQDCPPVARALPNGTLAGTLDAGSCQLGDHTPYAPYRLDLPVRGQIKIQLSGNTTDFSLDSARCFRHQGRFRRIPAPAH